MSAMTLAGVQTLHFAPYTAQQLLEIVQARLAPLRNTKSKDECCEQLNKFLPTPTLILLTKKVASLTGDVRALLEVLRGAINIAINAPVRAKNASNPLDIPTPSVTPAHVLDALKAYSPASSTSRAAPNPSVTAAASIRKTSSSEIIAKIQELGLQSRLALLSIMLARKRMDGHLPLSASAQLSPSTSKSTKRTLSSPALATISGVDIGALYSYYKTVLSRSEGGVFSPVSRSEFGDLLSMLETVGLVQLSASSSPRTPTNSAKRGLSRTMSLGSGVMKGNQDVKLVEGIRVQEVCKGLGIDGSSPPEAGDVKAEEVRAIWEKESIRISREVKAHLSNNTTTTADAFKEAFED
jgi:cell division control protein 6